MQFLLLIVPQCAGGCSMNSTKEWSMPRIQVYKVNKIWFLWNIFFCLSKLQLSHSLQCSSLLSLGTTDIWRTSGILFFLWCQTHCEKEGKALQFPWLQPPQVGHKGTYAASQGCEKGPEGTYVMWPLLILCFISLFSLQFFMWLSLGSACHSHH